MEFAIGSHGLTWKTGSTEVERVSCQARLLGVKPGWSISMIDGVPIETSYQAWNELMRCKKSGKKYQIYFTKDENSIREDQAKAEAEKARKAKQEEERKKREEIEKKIREEAEKKRADEIASKSRSTGTKKSRPSRKAKEKRMQRLREPRKQRRGPGQPKRWREKPKPRKRWKLSQKLQKKRPLQSHLRRFRQTSTAFPERSHRLLHRWRRRWTH